MPAWENRFWNFVTRHALAIAAIAATLVSLALRAAMLPSASNDMTEYLLPWYEIIRQGGGLRALGTQVGNYNMPYQTLIALGTCLPISPIAFYKLLAAVFDYLLAIALARLVRALNGGKLAVTLTYIAAVLTPTVLLDSAAWGQCDSIYTLFCVLTLILLIRNRPFLAFVCYGAAFAFKLQAVFLMPFLLFYCVYRRRNSILHFALVPGMMLLLSVPGLVMGQKLSNVFLIYFKQSVQYNRVSMNYPSLWMLLDSPATHDHYIVTGSLAIGVTIGALGALMLVLLTRRPALSDRDMLGLALFMCYTCVFFLPAMHERYSYPYVMLGLAVAALDPRTLPALLGLTIVDLIGYGAYLFESGQSLLPAVWLNALCYGFYGICLTWPLLARKSTPVKPPVG